MAGTDRQTYIKKSEKKSERAWKKWKRAWKKDFFSHWFGYEKACQNKKKTCLKGQIYYRPSSSVGIQGQNALL